MDRLTLCLGTLRNSWEEGEHASGEGRSTEDSQSHGNTRKLEKLYTDS